MMPKHIFKQFEDLKTANPKWVVNRYGDTLERPSWGWVDACKEYFIGIGYHGNEGGYYEDQWEEDKIGGHIPSSGYG